MQRRCFVKKHLRFFVCPDFTPRQNKALQKMHIRNGDVHKIFAKTLTILTLEIM